MNRQTYVGAHEAYTEAPVEVNEKQNTINDKIDYLAQVCGYRVEEVAADMPWGGYIELSSEDAEEFAAEFFKDLPYDEIHSSSETQPNPKILIISPGQQFDLQAHEYQARHWSFLTDGTYCESGTDSVGQLHYVREGERIQLKPDLRYQLAPPADRYAYIAQM